MFVKQLEGGGEIRARMLGNNWTISTINPNGKGVAVGLTLTEAGQLARLLRFEDRHGFRNENTGVIDARSIDGAQHEKENTP